MTLECNRLAGALGAVLDDFTVGDNSDAAVDSVIQHLNTHSLLLIQNQQLNAAHLVAFLDRFSQTMTPWNLTPDIISPDHPKAMVISSSGARSAGSTWHSDYSFIEQPADYSAFYMSAVPNVGGNTAFANMYAAYEALSEPMQTMLGELDAVHDNAHRHEQQFSDGDAYITKETYAKLPPVRHKLVRTHPDTDRKALYFGSAVTKAIVGVPYLESKSIISFLSEHCAKLEFSYRHTWSAGDLIIWDNRCIAHCAIRDYDAAQLREGFIVCSRAH
jgi:taurine dioxygenase